MLETSEIRLTHADMLAAQRLHSRREMRRLPWLPLVIVVMGGAAVLWAHGRTGAPLWPPDRALMAGMVAVLLYGGAVWLWGGHVLGWFSARGQPENQPSLTHPYRMQLDEGGLTASGAAGRWHYPWRDCLGYAEDGRVLLIYHAPRLFQILPRRALTPEMRALVARHLLHR